MSPPGRTVLGYPIFAQQPIHPQPGPAFRGTFQILRPTAPCIHGYWLLQSQQFGPHWIQMHVITDRLEVAVAAAIHDQRLVTTAEEMPEKLVPPVEARRVSAQ